MNNLAFLQLASEKLKLSKDSPIKMYNSDGKVILEINKQTWMGDTLDQCVSDFKQSLAIKYLEAQ